MSEESATTVSGLDEIRRKNREQDLNKTPVEAELSDDEYVDFKIDNWANGLHCSANDQGIIIKWLVAELRDVNKRLEALE